MVSGGSSSLRAGNSARHVVVRASTGAANGWGGTAGLRPRRRASSCGISAHRQNRVRPGIQEPCSTSMGRIPRGTLLLYHTTSGRNAIRATQRGRQPKRRAARKTSKDPSSFDKSTPSRTRTCNLVLSLPHQVSLTAPPSARCGLDYILDISVPARIVSTVSGGIPQPFGHSWPDCSSGPRCVKRFHGDILAD